MNEHDETLNRVEEKIDTLSKILLGNGAVGVCERVRLLENLHTKETEGRRWATRVVIIAALGVIGKVVFDLYQHLQ